MNTMTVSCRSTEQFLMILSASKQYMDIGPDVIFFSHHYIRTALRKNASVFKRLTSL